MTKPINPDVRESQQPTAELEEEMIQRLDKLSALSAVLALLAEEGLVLPAHHQANYAQVLEEQVSELRQLAVRHWG